MKKWEVACFIVVVLAFIIILSNLQVQLRDRDSLISNLQSENSDLQTQDDALQTQVDILETQVTALQAEKSNLMSQVSSLQNQKVALQTQVSNLIFQVSGLEAEISRLEEQIRSQILGVFFSPNGGCEDQVLYWIGRANVSINILIYSFTLDSVGDALIVAHNRGVEVQVVFEESQITTYSEYQKLKAAGISVRNDTNSDLMHDKVMVVDGYIVITGSFNWSENAEENNNENLIEVKSTFYGSIYESEFVKIWNQSEGSEPAPPLPQSDVVIDLVNYDAPGDDTYNLNGEYVVIRNKGTVDVNLAGWKLKDIANHVYTFPTFTLLAGQTVTVYTGSGANTENSLYWGSSSPIWNNDHDTAYLHNQMGELVDQKSW
jgi:hypothetical protein